MKREEIAWEGLGFPVVLVGFPMKTVRGNEVPDLNMNDIQEQAFKALILWPHRFTGQQVRFARAYMRKTQQELANEIAVNNTSVCYWESKGNEPTEMQVQTELILRFHMLYDLYSPNFRKNVTDIEWRRMRDKLDELFKNPAKITLEDGQFKIEDAKLA
jgi:DNA-binding transcriptional regulator YiaG